MTGKTMLLPAAAIFMLASCSIFSSPTSECILQSDGSKTCSIANPATGLTTRTVERGDKLYVSTCQMSQCTPFEELPAGRMLPRRPDIRQTEH